MPREPSGDPYFRAQARTRARKSGQFEVLSGFILTEKIQGLRCQVRISPRRNVPDIPETLYFTMQNGLGEAILQKTVEQRITICKWPFWVILSHQNGVPSCPSNRRTLCCLVIPANVKIAEAHAVEHSEIAREYLNHHVTTPIYQNLDSGTTSTAPKMPEPYAV